MRDIRFNAQYGRRADFLGIVPADYLLWWAAIIAVVLIPGAIVQSFNVNIPWLYYGLIPLGWTVHVLALGKRPYATLSQFHTPIREVVSYLQLHPSKTRIKPQIQFDLWGLLKPKVVPVEDQYDLSALIDYQINEERVGALFLERENKVRLVFAFESEGISSTTSEEACNQIAERLERGLKDFQRKRESFTVRASTFSECGERLSQLANESQDASPEIQFLYGWEKKTTQFLTQKGWYQPKTLRFYLTYTIDNRFEPQANLIQTVYAFCESLISRTTEPIEIRFEKVLREGFRQGYRGHQRYLKRIGFSNARPLTHEELYTDCWRKVRDGEPDHIPVHYQMTRTGVSEPIRRSDFSLLAHLFNGVAVEKRKGFVYLPGKKKVAGVAVLNSRPGVGWDGENRKEQLMFAVKALFDSETRDTEIVFQVSPEDPQDAIRRANRLANQGTASQQSAMKHGRRNRAAEFATSETDEADVALRRGARVVKFSLVLVVYRDTPEELQLAMNALEGCDCFGGGILARESEYASEIWSETLPFTYRDQLTAGGLLGLSTSQFDRRLTDTTQACIAFAPLMRDVSVDREGMLFISTQGRTPLFLNLLKEHPWRHMIVSAYTGHGKSVLICGLVMMLRALNANITIFDADIGDGQGSYRPLVDYLGGTYFTPTIHKCNLFEGGDWRRMDTEKRLAAEATFKNFLVSALADLSISQARDILSLLVTAFLEDPDIKTRRELAFDGGLGSAAWANFPTIKDFLSFATMERLPIEFQNERQEQILTDCKAKLRAKLALPEGAAIASPSTFPSDCPLTVASLGSAVNNDDALPTVLAIQANFLRTCLNRSGRSFLMTDEISRLRRFASIDQMCGDMWSRGRKMGVSCIAIGQDVDGLEEMQSAGDIFKNTNIYLTGHIESGADGMERRGIPRELLLQCQESSLFSLPKAGMASRWLMSCSGRHLIGDYYPSPALFALAMNQKSEAEIRKTLKLTGDKYQRLIQLTKHMMKGTIYDPQN